jgi:hypothetical protein
MLEFSADHEFEPGRIYVKIVGMEVLAFGDMESLQEAESQYQCGRLYDYSFSKEEWRAGEGIARLVDGKVVLGLPDDQKREKQEEVIRNERYMRLRQCDKISPMRWNAMSEEQKQAWTDYRNALLNIPQHKDFPWNGDLNQVPWPKQPE